MADVTSPPAYVGLPTVAPMTIAADTVAVMILPVAATTRLGLIGAPG